MIDEEVRLPTRASQIETCSICGASAVPETYTSTRAEGAYRVTRWRCPNDLRPFRGPKCLQPKPNPKAHPQRVEEERIENMPCLPESLRNSISKRLEKTGTTRKDLGELANVSRSNVSKALAGYPIGEKSLEAIMSAVTNTAHLKPALAQGSTKTEPVTLPPVQPPTKNKKRYSDPKKLIYAMSKFTADQAQEILTIAAEIREARARQEKVQNLIRSFLADH